MHILRQVHAHNWMKSNCHSDSCVFLLPGDNWDIDILTCVCLFVCLAFPCLQGYQMAPTPIMDL